MASKRRSERVLLQSKLKKSRIETPSADAASDIHSDADKQTALDVENESTVRPENAPVRDSHTETESIAPDFPSTCTSIPTTTKLIEKYPTEPDKHRDGDVDLSNAVQTIANLNSSEPKPMHIIIFQCANCRTMVADSTLGANISGDHESVLLSAASKLIISNDFTLSKSGFDAGCGYRQVSCAQCRVSLGRVYESTSPGLDNLRDLYILDSSSLITRTIGEGVTTKGSSVDDDPQRRQYVSHRISASSGAIDAPTLSTFSKLRDDHNALALKVHDLMEALEQQTVAIEHFRARTSAFDSKINEGETTLGHVHNLMLLWDERIRQIASLKR